MTIQQLQAYIDTKPDIRELINVIVDYIQGNPGGGGGNTIYTADDALVSDRTVDLDGKVLSFIDGGNGYLNLDPINFQSTVSGADGVAESYIKAQGDLGNTDVEFTIYSSDGTNPPVQIIGDGIAGTITHTATTSIFNGKIINPDMVANDFADDSAAATGGITVGGFYHTSGVVKVRLA